MRRLGQGPFQYPHAFFKWAGDKKEFPFEAESFVGNHLMKTVVFNQFLEDNKIKAYGLIFSHCNKVMQNRIEETPNFEADIRDDPLMLLREIKKKMYDPARAKYEFVTLTESLKRILSTTQENDEDLVQYTKRFKQARDIVKDSIGKEI